MITEFYQFPKKRKKGGEYTLHEIYKCTFLTESKSNEVYYPDYQGEINGLEGCYYIHTIMLTNDNKQVALVIKL